MIEDVLRDILHERRRQDKKWGADRNLDDYHWAAILGEEFGEVCEASLDSLEVGLRNELIQVAAVAVAWIECLDRNLKD